MDIQRISKHPRTSYAQHVAATPEAARKRVSVAGIFKKPAIPPKRTKVSPKNQSKDSRMDGASVLPEPLKLHTGSSQSSSPNPNKSPVRKSELHPLATAFKESTTAYRTHLYTATTAKLNATLTTLLAQLHANTPSTSPPSPNTPDSPSRPAQASVSKCCPTPKLTTKAGATKCDTCGQTPTAPAQRSPAAALDHTIANAFRPIGTYDLQRPHKNPDGSKTMRYFMLADVFAAFGKLREKDLAELKALEAQWETVVGEIYKLGVACLGEERMKGLGLLAEPEMKHTSEVSQALSPLFGDAEDASGKVGAVKESVAAKGASDRYPAFLSGPSVFANKPLAPLPEVPEREAKELQEKVGELGVKQVEDLRRIEEEHARWWSKKCEQIAQTLQAD